MLRSKYSCRTTPVSHSQVPFSHKRYMCKSCTTVPAYIKDNGKFKTDFISLLYDRLLAGASHQKAVSVPEVGGHIRRHTQHASHTSLMRTGLRHSIIPIPFRLTVPAGLHSSHNQHHREKRHRCADDPRWRRDGIAVAASLTAS